MTRLRASFRRHWWLALLLLLGANLARAAVPSGYMPSAGADGSITIKLCSGANWQLPLHEPGQGEQRPDHPCAFAGLAMGAALSPAPPAVAPPAFVAIPSPNRPTELAPYQAVGRPRPPARAPPTPV